MTTEVAIINKEAIALAADSAVTVGISDGTKIYNSANKLFALSRVCPVGIMVYGNAQLTGVPWESLIKVYRQKLGNLSFPELQDYCNDFIDFINKHIKFFPDDYQTESVISILSDTYKHLQQEISYAVEQAFSNDIQTKISEELTNKIASEVIEKAATNLENLDNISHFSESFIKEKTVEFNPLFHKVIDHVFSEFNVTTNIKNNLLTIAEYSLFKKTFSSLVSGIVIAGFGEEEIFPSLHTYDIECVFGNQLKYRHNEDKSHAIGNYPAIIPFAQEDMISTFIAGIDPTLENFSIHALEEILQKYFETIIDQAKESDSSEQPDFINQINKHFNQTKQSLLEKYNEKMIEFRREYHINPILDTVSILPKDELAAMAEALVSLTSLKRRVTTDAETVGRPTDVALISKGDGFIWIKRKHYFSAELNRDFFVRK